MWCTDRLECQNMCNAGITYHRIRLRRLTALFWGSCILACCFMLYVLTDLNLKLPNGRANVEELDETKWLNFENKLKHIEIELNQHHAVVGEIKSAVEHFVENSVGSEDLAPPVAKYDERHLKFVEAQGVAHRNTERKIIAEANCSIAKHTIPKTDVQMLTMYERMTFEDRDGGVWKQGWKLEYDTAQWNHKNQLKVFIVPHSHNDPGWLKTFESYYKSQTLSIFKNMIEKLSEDTKRKFIWAEVSYLSLWWNGPDITPKERTLFKKFLQSGQLELVTGGWVMNDEANSHWISIIQQLTTGHQWLIDNIGFIPKNSWAIDPFGHSSSQAYLLKLSQMENSLIQRVHYSVKKELAHNRQLEFRWRQLWDGNGKTDMFTHLMPFYSYDVPHTCGPDPKVCCQFDFRRLPGNGMSCPWGVSPIKITLKNLEERSLLILDQWRKKAQLYRSNVVLIPLGDDFRWDRASEWDNQFTNYDMVIDYINEREDLNAEIKFGTLEDYFKAVHSDMKMSEFPVLSGDFFTYADRNQHYWSGYYTSRPFYKNMDRVLLAYVRAAEMITTQASTSNAVDQITSLLLRDRVEPARRFLSLFQHHDGITGTARDNVVQDYAIKMHKSIKYCQSAIQQAAYYLLGKPLVHGQTQDDVYFEVDDVWRRASETPSRITIALDVMSPSRRVVLYNALAFTRHEVLTVLVGSPYVQVFNPDGKPIEAQVSPFVQHGSSLDISTNKFQLSFLVSVPAMALTTYTVVLTDSTATNKYTSYASLRIYNADYLNVDLPSMFTVQVSPGQLVGDLSLQAGDGARVVVTQSGLLKALVDRDGALTAVHMDIVQYGTQKTIDNNSGAYLFMPDGAANIIKPEPFPQLAIIEGPLRAVLYTGNTFVSLGLQVSLHNNPTKPQSEVEIASNVDIDKKIDDIEVALRFSTTIKNGDEFYTDLNGMQMIKRRYLNSLPLQANFYPLPGAAYIEDSNTRLTLLTSTPLGVAALQPGQIEVMQDRRLSRDDNRGLNQGVTDNVLTRHTFKLIVEKANRPCQQPTAPGHPSGQLTVAGHTSYHMLLQPLVVMHYSTAADSRQHVQYAPVERLPGVDVVVASLRGHLLGKTKNGDTFGGSGITYQRVYLDLCYGDLGILDHYPLGDGKVKISDLVQLSPDTKFYDSSLTFVHIGERVPGGEVTLCPMEVRTVFINQTWYEPFAYPRNN